MTTAQRPPLRLIKSAATDAQTAIALKEAARQQRLAEKLQRLAEWEAEQREADRRQAWQIARIYIALAAVFGGWVLYNVFSR